MPLINRVSMENGNPVRVTQKTDDVPWDQIIGSVLDKSSRIYHDVPSGRTYWYRDGGKVYMLPAGAMEVMKTKGLPTDKDNVRIVSGSLLAVEVR